MHNRGLSRNPTLHVDYNMYIYNNHQQIADHEIDSALDHGNIVSECSVYHVHDVYLYLNDHGKTEIPTIRHIHIPQPRID